MSGRRIVALTASGARYEPDRPAVQRHERLSIAALLAVTGPHDPLAIASAMFADDAARREELLARVARCCDDGEVADVHFAAARRLRVQAQRYVGGSS